MAQPTADTTGTADLADTTGRDDLADTRDDLADSRQPTLQAQPTPLIQVIPLSQPTADRTKGTADVADTEL